MIRNPHLIIKCLSPNMKLINSNLNNFVVLHIPLEFTTTAYTSQLSYMSVFHSGKQKKINLDRKLEIFLLSLTALNSSTLNCENDSGMNVLKLIGKVEIYIFFFYKPSRIQNTLTELFQIHIE